MVGYREAVVPIVHLDRGGQTTTVFAIRGVEPDFVVIPATNLIFAQTQRGLRFHVPAHPNFRAGCYPSW